MNVSFAQGKRNFSSFFVEGRRKPRVNLDKEGIQATTPLRRSSFAAAAAAVAVSGLSSSS